MQINELRPNQSVNLEIVIDERTYEITTKVVGSNESGVLVEPIEYKNRIIEFSGGRFKNVTFNLYADDFSHNRIGWLGVEFAVKKYKDSNYYILRTKAYNRDSVSLERRVSNRLNISNLQGLISIDENESARVNLWDINSNGISFICDSLEDASARALITFRDVIKGEEYSLALSCLYVRQMNLQDGQKLYAYKIIESDRKLLSYLFFKSFAIDDKAGKGGLIDELVDGE